VHCRRSIAATVEHFGHLDVLMNNAATQASRPTFEEIPDAEWDRIVTTNLSAMFHLVEAALPHLRPGASIIGASSVNSDAPLPTIIPLRRHERRAWPT
jgi:NAD(P)-dependent dehydrogenase (short-subunit alcohol dehydrogenase family)